MLEELGKGASIAPASEVYQEIVDTQDIDNWLQSLVDYLGPYVLVREAIIIRSKKTLDCRKQASRDLLKAARDALENGLTLRQQTGDQGVTQAAQGVMQQIDECQIICD